MWSAECQGRVQRESDLSFSIPHSAFRTPHSTYGTKILPDPLFPSLEAVTSANPAATARITTVWPKAPSMRATEESLTVHDTVRPERMFPFASRRVAKKLALSPAATVSGGDHRRTSDQHDGQDVFHVASEWK